MDPSSRPHLHRTGDYGPASYERRPARRPDKRADLMVALLVLLTLAALVVAIALLT